MEVSQFNIKIILINPGDFHTNNSANRRNFLAPTDAGDPYHEQYLIVTCHLSRVPRHADAPDAFAARLASGEFLESATVHGNSYGTLTSEVLSKLRAGKNALLNIDVQGAAAVRARAGEMAELNAALVTIFLTTPSFAELESRLRNRGTESPEILKRRLGIARAEIARWNEFDYLIVSGTMEEDLRRLEAILDAEKMRQRRAVPPEI